MGARFPPFQASFCGDKRAVSMMTACRLRRCLLYAVLASSIVLCVVLWSLPNFVQTAHHLIHTYACNDETSKLYLEKLVKCNCNSTYFVNNIHMIRDNVFSLTLNS